VHVPRPLLQGQTAVLHMHACSVPCRIAAIVSELNAKTGEVLRSGHRVRFLNVNQAGVLDLDLDEALCVECLPGNSPLSRLVLRIGGAMVAMGTAVEVLDAAA
jgi:translation elongation factor EF-1alpha